MSRGGDFHVIRFDGLYHVVFRPDEEPEWFRIIGSFYTYERAWAYCDVERCMTADEYSETHDEEQGGLRLPPIEIDLETAHGEADLPGMVRHIFDGNEIPPPHPIEDFADHPLPDEEPKDLRLRLSDMAQEEAKKAVVKQADRLGDLSDIPAEVVRQLSKSGQEHARAARREDVANADNLGESQACLYRHFCEIKRPTGLVEASLSSLANGAGVALGSMGFLIDSLEDRKLIEVVERGKRGRSHVYRVRDLANG